MLTPAATVEAQISAARQKVPIESRDQFDRIVGRLREQLVADVAARPWGGWLNKAERAEQIGKTVRRKTPWPRDERQIPFRLLEQSKHLAWQFDVEVLARGRETRTLAIADKKRKHKLATLKVSAWEKATPRFTRAATAEERAELLRLVDQAAWLGLGRWERPLVGEIVAVEDGGAWLVVNFGGIQVDVRASEVVLEDSAELARAETQKTRRVAGSRGALRGSGHPGMMTGSIL